MRVLLLVSSGILAMLVSAAAFAAGKQSPATQPPQATDDVSPPPPEPPKPGQQPKWSAQEELMSDLINAGDTPRLLLEKYYEKNHAWPKSLEDMPGASEKLPASIQSISLDSGGVVRVKFSANVPGAGGKFALLSPKLSSDGKSVDGWNCAAPDVPANDSPCPPSH